MSELDLMLLDWSEELTLRQVTQSYDLASQRVTEVIQETVVRGVAFPQKDQAQPQSARESTMGESSFWLRAEDVPEEMRNLTSRVMCRGEEWRGVGWELSGDGAVVVVRVKGD